MSKRARERERERERERVLGLLRPVKRTGSPEDEPHSLSYSERDGESFTVYWPQARRRESERELKAMYIGYIPTAL